MQSNELVRLVEESLRDLKAQDITTLQVAGQTTITDYMVIASGRSDRHVRSIAEHVLETTAAVGHDALGTEGQQYGEWVLVDLADVVVHIMQPKVRDFYKLENLWGFDDDMPDAESAN